MKAVRPNWLGYFYGGRLGFHNYEVLTIQHIPHTELKKESALMQTKWFDYRRLHPMQATYYFMKCYNEAYRDLWRKAIDHSAAPFVRAVKSHDFLESREKLSFWRLRQLCDLMGVPYDFFLNKAMDHYSRCSYGDKVYPPRPAQIYKNEDLIASIGIAWEEHCNVSTQIACDPYYRVSQFRNCRNQHAHEQFVVDQIGRRRYPKYALHAAIYIDDVLRVEKALHTFEQREVEDALELQLRELR